MILKEQQGTNYTVLLTIKSRFTNGKKNNNKKTHKTPYNAQ